MTLPTKKKLLVLDVNGLLVETFRRNEKRPKNRRPDGKVGKFAVYRRPYCKEFLTFCFENFEVGIWSSALQHNVQNLVDFIFGDLKSKLLFIWHQHDCTNTGLRTLENKMKPVFLKELSKLWDKLKADLPWEKGDYGPFNTLLIDDTPYKAMRNPLHTAIFPYTYEVSKEPDDVLGGALLKYLEGISAASNVQHYVAHHQFGQTPISEKSPHWNFYRKILSSRLSTVNRNSNSVLRMKTNGVANKTMTSIAYNNGTTQSSSIQEDSVHSNEREEKGMTKPTKSKKKKGKSIVQAALSQQHKAHNRALVEKEAAFGISHQSNLDPVLKENGLPETAVTSTPERHGDNVTTLSQKHATINELEETGAARATKSRKKKRKGAEQAALNQEPGADNISAVDKESPFGRSQQSDLDMLSKDDGLLETAVTCTTERNGAVITTLSQQHATLNGQEENGMAKATKRKKRKRKSVMQAALNQDHGAHNLSLVDEEAAFGIPQRCDHDMVSKDYSLFETAMTCTTERKGAIVTTLSWQHATLNRLEDNDVAKTAKPRKKKRKGAKQAALNQEHKAYNLSLADEEAAFDIPQRSDHDMVSKDDALFERAMTCTTQRNGAIITTLSEKHATLNGLEESGVAKARKPRRKKREGAEQAALNQEPEAHHISVVENETTFGISQQSDLGPVSKQDGLPETEVTCTAERYGAILTTLSRQHATLNGLEENDVVKATKPRRKKRKGAKQAALNQKPGADNISVMEKGAFGIFQQSDLDPVSKEDGLPETVVTCMAGRHGTIVTTLSEKHPTLNGLEESGVAKARKTRKKKRKVAKQAASNQEPEARNISVVEKEATFGISQQSDLDPVSKEDGLPETAVTCIAERHGAMLSSLSRQHATLDGLEKNDVAKATKPRKKKRKGAQQAALNQEPGADNISAVEKGAFGISQQSDLDPVSKEDGLPEIVVTSMAGRHGAIVTTLSEKHVTLNGLEESCAAKARKHGKKKRKGAEQVALNQEHRPYNISLADKEAAFGISQQSDLDMVSKEDGLPETAMTCTAGRHSAIVTALSQKHAIHNGLEESGKAKTTKPGKKRRERVQSRPL